MNSVSKVSSGERKLKVGIAVLLTFAAVIFFKALFSKTAKSYMKILILTNSLIVTDFNLRKYEGKISGLTTFMIMLA